MSVTYWAGKAAGRALRRAGFKPKPPPPPPPKPEFEFPRTADWARYQGWKYTSIRINDEGNKITIYLKSKKKLRGGLPSIVAELGAGGGLIFGIFGHPIFLIGCAFFTYIYYTVCHTNGNTTIRVLPDELTFTTIWDSKIKHTERADFFQTSIASAPYQRNEKTRQIMFFELNINHAGVADTVMLVKEQEVAQQASLLINEALKQPLEPHQPAFVLKPDDDL